MDIAVTTPLSVQRSAARPIPSIPSIPLVVEGSHPTACMQVHGMLVAETFEGMSLLDALNFGGGTIPRPILAANMAFMNAAAPFRLRGIWLFHQGRVVSVLMALVRPFLSAKLKQRIRAHGADFSPLHALLGGRERLPAEFGGSAGDDAHWAWFEGVVAQERAREREQGQAGQGAPAAAAMEE